MKVSKLKSEPREGRGTSAARRVRRQGRVPAVVYGEGAPAEHIAVDAHDFRIAVDHGARVVDLDAGAAEPERVLLVDVQYDALGLDLLHADFQRLRPDHEIHLRVPIEFQGTPKGLAEGGVLTVLRDTIEVRCLPRDIPESVPLEVGGLELGDSVVAGGLTLPEGVTLAEEADETIVSVAVPRAVKAEAAEGAEGEAAEGEEAGKGGEAKAGGKESSE